MGRPPDPARRAHLLAAATDYVIEHGMADLSLRPLAEALGTTHRSLLYHFGTKEQLFAAVLREARDRERLRATSQPAPETDAPGLAPALEATWRYLSGPAEDRFWRFYFEIHSLALRNPERYADGLRDGVDDWLALLEEALAAEGHGAQRARALATLILAAFRGLELDLLTTGDRARVDSGFAALLELLASVGVSERAP